MPDEREIARYEIDASQAQAELEKLMRLDMELKAQQAKSTAPADVNALLGGAPTPKMDEDLGATRKLDEATGDLVRRKQQLASVVGLVGGEFGGQVGRLLGLVQLLEEGSGATVKLAAGLAGVGALVGAYKKLQAEIEATIAKKKQLDDAMLTDAERRQRLTKDVEGELLGLGAATPANVRAAFDVRQAAGQEFGLELSPREAALAAAAGITGAQEAGILAMSMRQGAAPKTGQEAARLLEEERASGAFERLGRDLENWKMTETARDVRAAADVNRSRLPEELAPRERAFRAAQEGGLLPEGVTTFGDFARLAEIDLAGLEHDIAAVRGGTSPGPSRFLIQPKIDKMVKERSAAALVQRQIQHQAQAEMGALQEASLAAPATSEERQVIERTINVFNHNETYAGTIHNVPQRQTRGWYARPGASKHDMRVE